MDREPRTEEAVSPEAYPSRSPANTRQIILKAASNLIMRQGVNGTSLADIAREAEISKGTLFYHFAAKNDLIYEVTEQHFSRLTRNILRTVEEMRQSNSRSEILSDATRAIVQDDYRGRLNLYLLADAVSDNEALRERFRQTYIQYRATMKEFFNKVDTSMDPEKEEALASILIAILDGLIIQWLICPSDVNMDHILELMDSFW